MELPLELWLPQAATLGNSAEASAHSSRRTLPPIRPHKPLPCGPRALLTGRPPRASPTLTAEARRADAWNAELTSTSTEICVQAFHRGRRGLGREAHLPVQPDVSGRITSESGG